MTKIFIPHGVCSRKITIELSEDGIIESVAILGGCNGNSQGICRLVAGMKAEDAIKRLENIDCNGKGTSCPDQLSKALKEAVSEL